MASATETALGGLLTVLGGIAGPRVERNIDTPLNMPAGGLLIVRDGDPGEPEVSLSPLMYHYEHGAEIEVLVQDEPSTRDGVFDALLGLLSNAIAADRTLGGTVDYTVVGRPSDTAIEPVDGAAGIKGGTVPVTLYYDTNDPLN